MKTGEITAAFRIVRPAAATPLVYAVPHAGPAFPEAGREALQAGEATLRSLEDPLVDRLVEGAEALGATILVCEVARAFVDVNRDPAEIDPALTEGGRDTARTRAGLGVVPRLGGDGRPLHRRRLAPAEVQARIAAVHAPYHAALAALMTETRAAFGLALLIDWHSMPSAATAPLGRRGGVRPQVVIGDRHGDSAASGLAGVLRGAFEARGRRVTMNRPFAGGWTTQAWGRPSDGFHALQVEVDRDLYLDGGALDPGPGFDNLRGDIRLATETLLAALATKKAAPEGAA